MSRTVTALGSFLAPFSIGLLLSMLGLVLPAQSQAPAVPTWQPLPDALREAARTNTPTLVYIHAAWCAPCRRLERETFADATVAARLERFSCTALSFDDRDRTHRVGPYRLSEAGWATRLGAASTPTLVFLAPDGSLLARHTGFLPPDGLVPILDAALAALF